MQSYIVEYYAPTTNENLMQILTRLRINASDDEQARLIASNTHVKSSHFDIYPAATFGHFDTEKES